MLPLTSITKVKRVHRDSKKQLLNYLTSARGRSLYPPYAEQMCMVLTEVGEKARSAANLSVRNVYAGAAIKTAAMQDIQGNDPVSFVTFTPDIGAEQDWRCKTKVVNVLKQWFATYLSEFNAFGVIETLLYVRTPLHQYNGLMSWHIHALIWGYSEKKLEKLIARLNNECRCYFYDREIICHRPLESVEIPGILAYMFKAPVKGANVYNSLNKMTDSTRPRQQGDILTPKTALRVLERLDDYSIEDLFISAGEGRALSEEIRRRGREVLERRERNRAEILAIRLGQRPSA